MKKVLINLVILVATAINITGVMGQTAKNDPNAIGIYQMTPEQSMAQLTGTAKWEGNVSRDVSLNQSVETINRYNDQLDWGFAPISKDYYVTNVLPKLKTGTMDPSTDDPLIGGRDSRGGISMNDNPGFTKDDQFWYWDVRSYNHPSETYRIYLYKVACNNPVEYFQKLDEVPLVNTVTKIDTLVEVDTFTVYQEKLVEVPVVGTTTAAMPDIINNNYNYNTNYPSGSSGGYSESGGNYWTEQPSYGYGGYGGQSCYPGCFLCNLFGYLCPIHCHNSYGGGQCNYQQSCQQAAAPGTTVVINEGDTNVEVVVVIEDNDDDGGDNTGGPDVPDDDPDTGSGGPDIPDDDTDITELSGGNSPIITGDGTDGGPVIPGDGRFTQQTGKIPQIVGADEFQLVQDGSKKDATKPKPEAPGLLALNGPKVEVQMGTVKNPKGNDIKPSMSTSSSANSGEIKNPVVKENNGTVVGSNSTKSNAVNSNTDVVVVNSTVKNPAVKNPVVKENNGTVVSAPTKSNTKGVTSKDPVMVTNQSPVVKGNTNTNPVIKTNSRENVYQGRGNVKPSAGTAKVVTQQNRSNGQQPKAKLQTRTSPVKRGRG